MIFQKKRAELSISRDLVEPTLTRWASQVSCLESFLINKPSLQLAMLDGTIASNIDSELKRLIPTDEFFKKSAISVAITHYHAFWKRSTELDTSIGYNEELIQHVNQRSCMFYHPIMLLALRLDPKVDGRCIPPVISESEDISAIMEKLIPEECKRNRTLFQYFQYRAREGPFLSKHLWAVMDTTSIDTVCWWKACFRDSAPELCELAIRVLNAPVSSAAVERAFSAYGYVHNSSRNRLFVERSEKLMFLYHNRTSDASKTHRDI